MFARRLFPGAGGQQVTVDLAPDLPQSIPGVVEMVQRRKPVAVGLLDRGIDGLDAVQGKQAIDQDQQAEKDRRHQQFAGDGRLIE